MNNEIKCAPYKRPSTQILKAAKCFLNLGPKTKNSWDIILGHYSKLLNDLWIAKDNIFELLKEMAKGYFFLQNWANVIQEVA